MRKKQNSSIMQAFNPRHFQSLSQGALGAQPNFLRSLVEYLFYAYMFVMPFMDIYQIEIPLLGFIWLACLALLSIMIKEREGRDRKILYLICATGLVFLFIQIGIYKTDFYNEYLKTIVIWVLIALIMDAQVSNPQFIKHLATVMLGLILVLWPNIMWEPSTGGIERVTMAEGTLLDSPNMLGNWLGFCALVFWLWGWTLSDQGKRWVLWSVALLAFMFLLQTVSRGALLAFGIAFLVTIKGIKRWQKIILIVCLPLLLYGLTEINVFSQSFEQYENRGLEETGRGLIWPEVIHDIIQRPWLGYGLKEVTVNVLGQYKTPHNAILMLWKSSGVLPVLLFLILWGYALYSAIKPNYIRRLNFIDPLPLLVFFGIEVQISNMGFVETQAVAALCYVSITTIRTRRALSKNSSTLSRNHNLSPLPMRTLTLSPESVKPDSGPDLGVR